MIQRRIVWTIPVERYSWLHFPLAGLNNIVGPENDSLFIYRLLITIIEFYIPLFYYCVMTSAGGNVYFLSHGDFLPSLFRIPKDNKIVYNNFLFTSPLVPSTHHNYYN